MSCGCQNPAPLGELAEGVDLRTFGFEITSDAGGQILAPGIVLPLGTVRLVDLDCELTITALQVRAPGGKNPPVITDGFILAGSGRALPCEYDFEPNAPARLRVQATGAAVTLHRFNAVIAMSRNPTGLARARPALNQSATPDTTT